MKVVLDTNVIIAAFATQGLCYLVFESVIAYHQMILSNGLLKEIQNNLERKLKLPKGRVKQIMDFLRAHATVSEDREAQGLQCRDPEDVKVLALAVNTDADVIVTGDQDLLILQSTFATSILSPREFWGLLKNVQA